MRHPFTLGQSYAREEILSFLGSRQWQSGIAYGSRQTDLVALFTGGRHGARAGYSDQWNSDGSFTYCGQGTKGNQRLMGANRILVDLQRTILLFETWRPLNSWKGRNKFVGEFLVAGYRFEEGRGKRSGDQLLTVTLVPSRVGVNDNGLPSESRAVETRDSFKALRDSAVAASQAVTHSLTSLREFRARADQVARYVQARSRGYCEMCDRPAPFNTPRGVPYLEVHHTRRLADDGPDDILHVAAICPNCHREAHYGPDPDGFRLSLEAKIELKERRES